MSASASASASASTSTCQSNDWQSSSSSTSPHPAALLLDDVFSRAQLEIALDSDSGQNSEAHGGNQSQSTSGSASDNQRQRQVAFYDETLRPRIQLYLPPSTALPSPDPSSSASSLTFPLPLPQENELEEVEHGSEASLNKPPKLISILLSSLQISLEASYISPQPISLPPSHSSSFQTTTSTNSHPNFTPLPTVPAGEAGYQLQPSSSQAFQNSNPPLNLTPLAMQNYQNWAPATFHSSSWFGNKIPTNTSEEKESNDLISKSNVSWIAGKDGSKGRWKIVWETETPIVYVRSRHNSPLVALTATLSLRISSHLLSILLPLSKSNTELSTPFPPHDLLTNLSSGPIYPDESPLERASRMNKNSSSLSNLPLDRLGQEILGSTLVTLEQGRTALSKMTRKESSIPLPHEDEAESDLADIGSSSYSSSERRDLERRRNVGGIDEFDLSDVGSRSGASPSKPSQEQKSVIKDHSIGSEVRVIRRSCRRTLDVRSAIAVRMRTLLAPPLVKTQKRSKSSGDVKEGDDESERSLNDDSGYDSDSDSDLEAEFELLATRDSSLERALVLCVELENPPDSGIKFEIQSCSIKMEGSEDRKSETDKRFSSSQTQAKLNATLFEDENVHFPMVLDQGQQVNALYYVELNLGEEEISSLLKDDGRANQRHATIVVGGRPLLLKDEASIKESETQGYHLDGNDGQTKVEAIPSTEPSATTSESLDHSIPKFWSTWNCQIDTTVLQNALNRRRAASLINSSVTAPINSQRQTSSNIAVSSSIVAGDANFAASTLAQSAAEEAARFQSSSNPQLHTPQGRKSVSPIPPRSPLNSVPPVISTSGPAAVLSQRRDTLTVDSPIGISPNRGRLASLTGVGGVPFSPASMTPRSSSFGLGPPPITGGSTGFTSNSSGSFGGARTPSGGVGLGLLASAKNRASSLQATSSDTSMSGLASSLGSQSPITVAQQRPLMDRVSSVQAPRTPLPATPGNDDNEIHWWPSNSGISSRKDVLPWTSSSGPSAASLLRGIDAQSPILVSTKVETNRTSRSQPASSISSSGDSVPSVNVLESFSLVVLIVNREVENRSFMVSWPQVELDSDGEVVSQKDGQAALVKGPRGSLVSNSLFIKSRLLDAEGARRAHATVQSSQQRSALLPEENHLMIGPILPGTSESVHLPIKALIPGIHPIAPNGLLISDVETAEERRLFDVANIVVKENDVQLEI